MYLFFLPHCSCTSPHVPVLCPGATTIPQHPALYRIKNLKGCLHGPLLRMSFLDTGPFLGTRLTFFLTPSPTALSNDHCLPCTPVASGLALYCHTYSQDNASSHHTTGLSIITGKLIKSKACVSVLFILTSRAKFIVTAQSFFVHSNCSIVFC